MTKKIGILLLIIASVFMILGLILISLQKGEHTKNVFNVNGFTYLKTLSIGYIFEKYGLVYLKIGIILSIIFAPILGIIGLIILIYEFYKKNNL